MHKLSGSCHCGNLRMELGLPAAPQTYSPRACDCAFCSKHGAAYLSDPGGRLHIRVGDERQLRRYRQGSGIADCLVCANCGVLVAIAYRSEGRLYATVNARAIDAGVVFAESQPVSPKLLSAGEKPGRWENLWFADVRIDAGVVVDIFARSP